MENILELIWLVVLTILKNMKVNGKDYPIYIMEGQKNHVPNRQSDSRTRKKHLLIPTLRLKNMHWMPLDH